MAVELAQGSVGRGILIWFLRDSGFFRGFILGVAAIILMLWSAGIVMYPPVINITTTHEIYLPAKAEMAERVDNFFQLSGMLSQGGGIAVPGVNMADMAGFRAKEGEHAAIFMVLEKQRTAVLLHYFGFNSQPFFIRQAEEMIASPGANKWGAYLPVNARVVKSGKFIVDREFALSQWALIIIILSCLWALAMALVINWILSRLLWLFYRRQFQR